MRKALLGLSLALVASGAANAANLVTNGDFSLGNDGSFASDYSYLVYANNQSLMYPEGTYTIGNDPNAVHNLWISSSDFGLASLGAMLIANGKENGLPSTVWSQDINVTAGQYSYSLDVINICCNAGYPASANAPSILAFQFSSDNGTNWTDIDGLTTDPNNDEGQIQNLSGQLTLNTGLLRFAVRNAAGAAGGNDFAIDNISLAAVPEPTTWMMMFSGLGLVGFSLRRRHAPATA